MKKLSLILLLLASSCAIRSPKDMQNQEPDFQLKWQSNNFVGVTECIFKKVDNFPISFQLLESEDPTLPAKIRQLSNQAELYQEVGGMIVSLIRLDKISPTKIEAKLYTGNSITNERVQKNYPKIITDCFAEEGSK